MPYIKNYDRKKYQKAIDELAGILVDLSNDKVAGELNYLITSLCNWALMKYHRYVRFNAVIGALECSKIELYRRKIVPYENKKIEENGDVY